MPDYELPKPRFKGWASFSDLDSKRSVIVGSIVRAKGYTMPAHMDLGVATAVVHNCMVLQAAGFPVKFITSTILGDACRLHLPSSARNLICSIFKVLQPRVL